MTVTSADVARMTWSDRVARVERLLIESRAIVADAIKTHSRGRELVATCILFSGGNDSTVLAHIFKNQATHAIHANTGVGIEPTRQFVRDTCEAWGLPLIEQFGEDYRTLVLDQGFPGPAHHWKMYGRLKERALDKARHVLGIANRRKVYALFLGGRRREESDRRKGTVDYHSADGTVTWCSPLADWTKLDLNTYRLMHRGTNDEVPTNDVTRLIHMSGECLCGSFAHPHEFHEISMWFPDFAAWIEKLEAEVLASGRHPAWKCRWGWGADKHVIKQMKKDGLSDNEIAALLTRSDSGPLCSSCAAR